MDDAGGLLTSHSQIKFNRSLESGTDQSEVEGIPIWRSLRLWFTLPDYPDKEKRLGSAPGAEFTDGEWRVQPFGVELKQQGQTKL